MRYLLILILLLYPINAYSSEIRYNNFGQINIKNINIEKSSRHWSQVCNSSRCINYTFQDLSGADITDHYSVSISPNITMLPNNIIHVIDNYDISHPGKQKNTCGSKIHNILVPSEYTADISDWTSSPSNFINTNSYFSNMNTGYDGIAIVFICSTLKSYNIGDYNYH